ncbi:hypothetical protein EKO27_g6961 [Xylaria grammica]|uniref:Gamma-glutamylcyclotransferase AIG2-like domain-containing protein n=1 Tax=Xylaria grammica TaxID=363999 RepID=A0A439D167_9PEZI|nr:hypothetical protein EKO27_g6961 [Xylaria grammica]
MHHSQGTPAVTPTATTEEGQVVASFPPIESQNPTAACDTEANAHNMSILAIRGLQTTAMGSKLRKLADMALCNYEIATTPNRFSSSHRGPPRILDEGGKNRSKGEDVVRVDEIVVTTFKPFYFFFYGSLQVREVLQSVCRIPGSTLEGGGTDPIVLRKGASIEGWVLKMWGPYPALLPSTANNTVQGMAWLCEKPEYVPRLCSYETDAYRMAYCDISIPSADGDGVEVLKNARTFVSTLDGDELSDGRFSIAEYMNMMQLSQA